MTLTELRSFAEHYDGDLRKFRLSGDVADLFDFVQAALGEFKGEISDEIGFMNALTDNEHKAYEAIIEEIGKEGNISVVKMLQKTGLSRPVFTSLLQKMEKYHMALVQNQGVKGTHIVFLDIA